MTEVQILGLVLCIVGGAGIGWYGGFGATLFLIILLLGLQLK